MYALATENELEESIDMGSFNHGYTMVRVAVSFDKLEQFTAVGELSLDVSGADLSKYDLRTKEELKPDLCLYLKRGRSRPTDVLRMTEMPLLAVEILSPKQGTYEILEKFKLYFDLGIRSCWLVDPAQNTVVVYASINESKTFSSGDVVDEKLGIKLPLQQLLD